MATGAAACSETSDGRAECVARATSAIYSGFAWTADAGSAVSVGDRARAIVGVEDANGDTFCTGIVVHPRWVLTAAHCADPEAFLRVVGRTGAAVTVPVKAGPTHPSVDLALLEVLSPDDLVLEGIPTIALRAAPVTADVSVGTMVLLGGVGLTEDGGSGELRFVEEPVTAMTKTTITVDGKGKSGACEGDSGGPLIAWTGDRPEAVGVLRAGSANCRGLDEYIRIDVHHEWITGHLLPLGSPGYCTE